MVTQALIVANLVVYLVGASGSFFDRFDPEALASRNRTYVYDYAISRDRAIVIDRTKDVGKRKAAPFRLAEDFSDTRWKRVLRFKPGDLSVADRLRFDINGPAGTDRLKGDFLFEMSDPSYSARYEMDLADSPARFGDNEFGVTLIEANSDLKGWTPVVWCVCLGSP